MSIVYKILDPAIAGAENDALEMILEPSKQEEVADKLLIQTQT